LPSDVQSHAFEKDKIESLATQLTERAAELRKTIDPETKKKLEDEYDELSARITVGKNEALIKGEVERKKKITAYQLCIDDTNTYHITRKSTELTNEVVTGQLRKAFNDELDKLRFRHVEVELQEAGGERGALYHKLVLKRAPTMSVPKVVSEGEQQRYEREAIHIYGLLRETWERSFEEVLLDGTVERYRVNVQTQQVRKVADITEQDCTELDAGMEKSSKWLAGHDLAPAENESVPEPDELRADIDALIGWVDRIRRRRG